MAEFTKTTTYTLACPACDSDRVVKDGFQKGTQRYECKNCKKKFRANGKAEGRRMDAEMMGSAIRDFYTGKSYKQIAEGLKEGIRHTRTQQVHHLRMGEGLHRRRQGTDGGHEGPGWR